MLAALQERTQYRPTTDSALMKWIVRHAAWFIRGNEVQLPVYRAMGCPYRGTLLEFDESVLAHGKGSGNLAPKLAGNPLCGWGNSDLTDEHLTRTNEGVVYARSVRQPAEHSWSEENLPAVVEAPQRPKTTIADIPLAVEPLALPHEPPEAAEDAKEEPTGEQEEDNEMQGEPVDTKEATGTSSSGRGEQRTETQENVPVKKRLMMKSPRRPVTPVSPPDDPVKRRLLKKTDQESSDVFMAVEIKDTDLLHTVNTLLNEETGEEEKPGVKRCRG